MNRSDKAVSLHNKGYNCCQSVVCVFADELGVDEKTLYRISEGFGLGAGNMNGICGALSGAVLIAGMLGSDGNTDDPGQTKRKTYKIAGEMQAKFVSEAKALYCRDIKKGNNGGAFTSCGDCVRIAVGVVEDVLGL